MTDTRDRLFGILRFYVPAKVITDATRFAEDLNLDSLDLLEIGIFVEQEFCVTIPDGAFEHVATVGQMLSVVETATAQKAKAA